MRIIEPSYKVILPYPSWDMAKSMVYNSIELAGRTCYKSESKMTAESAGKLVANIIKAGHEAMLEHANMTVRFIVDRGVSHEIVRHRLASFAQESTRYCNYGTDKFGKEISFIRPFFLEKGTEAYKNWEDCMRFAEACYMSMLAQGCTPEQARSVLPNSVKTEIVMTANMREWRHFFKLRAVGTTGKPHPQMVQVAMPLLKEMQEHMPELFGDIEME